MTEWCPTMPPWVRRIPVGKGHDLNVMARTILEGLWFCAPVSRDGAMFTGPVDLGRWTPTIPVLAEVNGVTEVSAAKALKLVLSVGWATRKGHALVLAWQEPWAFGGLATRSPRNDHAILGDRTIPEDPIPEDRTHTTRGSHIRSPGSVESIPEDRPLLTTPLPHYPHLHLTADKETEPEQATFALVPLDPTPTRADRVGELRAAHERLAIAAHAHHGHPSRGTTARGSLPKPGTKPSNTINRRISEACAAYGFEACLAMIEWRAAEWRDDKAQLARPAEQAWSENAVKYVLSKIDEGVDHRDRGKHSSGGMIRHPMTVISRGGDEFE